MMKLKYLFIVLLFSLTITVLAGCNGVNEPVNGEVSEIVETGPVTEVEVELSNGIKSPDNNSSSIMGYINAITEKMNEQIQSATIYLYVDFVKTVDTSSYSSIMQTIIPQETIMKTESFSEHDRVSGNVNQFISQSNSAALGSYHEFYFEGNRSGAKVYQNGNNSWIQIVEGRLENLINNYNEDTLIIDYTSLIDPNTISEATLISDSADEYIFEGKFINTNTEYTLYQDEITYNMTANFKMSVNKNTDYLNYIETELMITRNTEEGISEMYEEGSIMDQINEMNNDLFDAATINVKSRYEMININDTKINMNLQNASYDYMRSIVGEIPEFK